MPTPYKPIQTNGKKVQHLNGRPSKYNWRSHTKMLFGFSQRLVFGLFTASLYIYRNVGERGKTCRKGPSQSRSRATASGPQPIWYALYPMIPLHVVLLVHHCIFHCPDKCVCVCVLSKREVRDWQEMARAGIEPRAPRQRISKGEFSSITVYMTSIQTWDELQNKIRMCSY